MRWETGVAIWFTGVPAAGKSTIAGIIEKRLRGMGERVQNLDSDVWRSHVSPDLKYSEADRDLNTKRLAYVQSMLTRNGVHGLVAAVSSMQSFRDRARELNDKFVEVFVKCPLEECKKRDPKGLYARGERGEVNDIAGWHQVYEEPASAEIILDTTLLPPEQCADLVIQTMTDLGFLPKDAVYSEEEAEEVQQRLADLGYL